MINSNLSLYSITTLIIGFVWFLGNVPSFTDLAPVYTHADWKLAQYNVNYIDHGFVRRGLIGTLLWPVFEPIVQTPNIQKYIIFWAESFIFIILSYSTALFIYIRLKQFTHQVRILIFAIVSFSPCGLIQFSYDFGRLDHIIFCIFAICFFLHNRRALILTSAILVLAILVHEASIFFLHPFVASLYITKSDRRLFDLTILAIPSSILALLIFLFGDKAVDLDAAVSLGGAVWGENIHLYIFNLVQKPSDILFFGFYGSVVIFFLIDFYRQSDIKVDLMYFSCLAPMGLFVIGADWGRWVHFLFILAVTNFILKLEEMNIRKIPTSSFLLLLVLAVPLGPIGIGGALPYLEILKEKLLHLY